MRQLQKWEITGSDKNAHDIISALQKAIRRGDVRLACYWAAELFESGFGPHV
jgi:replication-associated recombination protein RarA